MTSCTLTMTNQSGLKVFVPEVHVIKCCTKEGYFVFACDPFFKNALDGFSSCTDFMNIVGHQEQIESTSWYSAEHICEHEGVDIWRCTL